MAGGRSPPPFLLLTPSGGLMLFARPPISYYHFFFRCFSQCAPRSDRCMRAACCPPAAAKANVPSCHHAVMSSCHHAVKDLWNWCKRISRYAILGTAFCTTCLVLEFHLSGTGVLVCLDYSVTCVLLDRYSAYFSFLSFCRDCLARYCQRSKLEAFDTEIGKEKTVE